MALAAANVCGQSPLFGKRKRVLALSEKETGLGAADSTDGFGGSKCLSALPTGGKSQRPQPVFGKKGSTASLRKEVDLGNACIKNTPSRGVFFC